MLTPTYLEHVPDEMAALWQMVEDDILRDVARRIKANTGLTATADWQLHKLDEMRLLQNSITRTLAKYSGINGQTLRSVLKRAGFDSLAGDKKYYEAMGITPGDPNKSEILLNLLTAGYEQTAGTWKNLTQTTARTVTGQFEAAMDRAQLQVQSGAFDYQTAVRRACDTLGSDMKFVEYPTGHRDTLEVAVRRAVLTGVNQTAGKLQTARMDEYGIDFVETTAHMGARPSHAEWQGKVFHRGGQIEYKGKMYRDFVEATRYGYGDGLCGWNCRHNFYPFIPGLSEPAYDQKELERLNARDQLYRGKLYTEYEMSQMQRALERKVRAAKKDFILAEEAGFDPHYAAVKYNNSLDRLRDFCNETGRRMDSSRTSVTGFSSEERRRALRASRTVNPTLPKPPKPQKTPKETVPPWASPDRANRMAKYFANQKVIDKNELEIWNANYNLRTAERALNALTKPSTTYAELEAKYNANQSRLKEIQAQIEELEKKLENKPKKEDYLDADGFATDEYWKLRAQYKALQTQKSDLESSLYGLYDEQSNLSREMRNARRYEDYSVKYEEAKRMAENAKALQAETDALKAENATLGINAISGKAETAGVEYRPVTYLQGNRSEEDIIHSLSGGDKTTGSCASLGLAYCGQKSGYDVIDFRGGNSQTFFSRTANLREISQLPGLKTISHTAASSTTAANQLLKQVEPGKQYYFVAGQHCAIVQKTETGYQYLELQASWYDGWTNFSKNTRATFENRFGCTSKTNPWESTAFMIEVDSFKNCEALPDFLGYINTAESEQQKGRSGTIK